MSNAIEDVDIIINMIVGKAAEEQATRIGKTLDDVLKKSDAAGASAGRMADQYKRAADEAAKIRFPASVPGGGGGGGSGGDPPGWVPPGVNPDGSPNYGPRGTPTTPTLPVPGSGGGGRGGGRTPTAPLPGDSGGGGGADIDNMREKIDALRAALELLVGSQFVVWLGRIGTLIRGVGAFFGTLVGGITTGVVVVAALVYAGYKLTQWLKDYINDTKRSNELEAQRLEIRERLIEQAGRLQQVESRRTDSVVGGAFGRAQLEIDNEGGTRANQGGSAESILMNASRARREAEAVLAARRGAVAELESRGPLVSGGDGSILRANVDLRKTELKYQEESLRLNRAAIEAVRNESQARERMLETTRQQLEAGQRVLDNEKRLADQLAQRVGRLSAPQRYLAEQAAGRLSRGTGDREDAIILEDQIGGNRFSREYFQKNAGPGGNVVGVLAEALEKRSQADQKLVEVANKLSQEEFADSISDAISKVAAKLERIPAQLERDLEPLEKFGTKLTEVISKLGKDIEELQYQLDLEEQKRDRARGGRGGRSSRRVN